MVKKNLPDWLVSYFRVPLLGEIYPSIRAIAVKFDKKGKLLIRYYLDRKPLGFDYESIDVVATNLDAAMRENLIQKIDVECVFFDGPGNQMDALDGFVYARREYEMDISSLSQDCDDSGGGGQDG